VGNVTKNVYAKSLRAAYFWTLRELITTRATRVAFWDPSSGSKNNVIASIMPNPTFVGSQRVLFIKQNTVYDDC